MPFMLDPRDPRWKANVDDNADPLAWYLAQTRTTPDDLVDQMSPGALQKVAKFGVDQFTDPQNLLYNQMGIGSFIMPGAKSLLSAIAGRLGRKAKPAAQAAPKVAEAAEPFVPKAPSWSSVVVKGKAAPTAVAEAAAPTVGRTTNIARKLWKAKLPILGASGAGLAYKAGWFGGGGLPEEETPPAAPSATVTPSGGGVPRPRPSPQVDYSGLDQVLTQGSPQTSPLGRAIAPPIAPPIQGKSSGVDWMELLKVFGPMLAAVLLSRR